MDRGALYTSILAVASKSPNVHSRQGLDVIGPDTKLAGEHSRSAAGKLAYQINAEVIGCKCKLLLFGKTRVEAPSLHLENVNMICQSVFVMASSSRAS